MKARPNQKPCSLWSKVDWMKVAATAFLGCALILCVSQFLCRRLEAALQSHEVVPTTGVASEFNQEHLLLPQEPGRKFRYPNADDIGDPIPFDPAHSAYPAISDSQRLRLQDIEFTKDGDIPEEFMIE